MIQGDSSAPRPGLGWVDIDFSQTVSLSGTSLSLSPSKMTILLLHWLAWERDTSKLPCLQASFRPFYSFIRAVGISNAHNEHEFLYNFGLFVRHIRRVHENQNECSKISERVSCNYIQQEVVRKSYVGGWPTSKKKTTSRWIWWHWSPGKFSSSSWQKITVLKINNCVFTSL